MVDGLQLLSRIPESSISANKLDALGPNIRGHQRKGVLVGMICLLSVTLKSTSQKFWRRAKGITGLAPPEFHPPCREICPPSIASLLLSNRDRCSMMRYLDLTGAATANAATSSCFRIRRKSG